MCRIVDNGAENIENLQALGLHDVQRSRFPPAAIARQEVPPCDSSGAGAVGRAAVPLPGREAFPDAAGAILGDPTAKPLCIDLFCGLGGWTEGFLAEGYRVVGFDIEIRPYPAQLVIQNVLTIHGSQFKDAAVIVASPPCQKYSYLAMPWSRSKDPNNSKAAKALRKEWETNGPDNRLFDACFRIQREAIEATDTGMCAGCGHDRFMHDAQYGCGDYEHGKDIWTCNCDRYRASHRYIPLIVENVRGAQPWVGRSAWNYGSFHLWGDVPALMPINLKRGHVKVPGVQSWSDYGKPGYKPTAFNGQAVRNCQKVPGFRFDGSGRSFQTASVESTGIKVGGHSFEKDSEWHRARTPEDTFGWGRNTSLRNNGSRSNARKMASAQIAKIPFELARHVAQVYYPRSLEQAAGGPRRMGKTECR